MRGNFYPTIYRNLEYLVFFYLKSTEFDTRNCKRIDNVRLIDSRFDTCGPKAKYHRRSDSLF